jgi:dihydrofolate reductase
MHVSLDGYMAGSKGEMNWIVYDKELEATVTDLRKNVDATLYGRNTYQMMEYYWPGVLKDSNSPANQLEYARWVDKKLKVVVSCSLNTVTWNNSRLLKDNPGEEIIQLKKELKGDILLIGSAQLTHSLLKLGIIDEFRININPVLLGTGIPLFKDVKEETKIKLVSAQPLNSGVIVTHYKKINGE